jgi:uncharacterized protein YsxB (DUF464 family)
MILVNIFNNGFTIKGHSESCEEEFYNLGRTVAIASKNKDFGSWLSNLTISENFIEFSKDNNGKILNYHVGTYIKCYLEVLLIGIEEVNKKYPNSVTLEYVDEFLPYDEKKSKLLID